MGSRVVFSLGAIAALIDLLLGVLILAHTLHFSKFLLIALFDASPTLIAGIGVLAGLFTAIKKPRSKRGGAVVLITGLVPVLTLYDIIRTVVVYGSKYISYPSSLIFLLLLVIPMMLSSTSGALLLGGRHPSQMEK